MTTYGFNTMVLTSTFSFTKRDINTCGIFKYYIGKYLGSSDNALSDTQLLQETIKAYTSNILPPT